MAKKQNDDNRNLAITYEASIRYLVEKSNKRAWFIAFLCIVMSILAITAVLLLTPLKTVVPYVIRVDNVTGMVDIVTSVDETTEFLSDNEALDKYFINQYVKSREGYYYDILQQDYVKTQLYSAPNIAEEYRAIYEGSNNRVEELKNQYEVRVNIKSIVLGNSAGVKNSTIRFDLNRWNFKGKTIDKVTSKIATLTYDYAPSALTTEQERIENPLGFKVLNYRVDDEITR